MAETHNLNLGIDAQISKIKQKLNSLANSVENFSAKMTKVQQQSKKINATTNAFNKQEKQVKKNITRLKQYGMTSTKTFKKVDKFQGKVDDSNKKIKDNTKAHKENKNATENWLSSKSESIKIAIKSIAIWEVGTRVVYGLKDAFTDMNEVMKNVNTEMVALRRVMSDATTDFVELRDTAADLGVQYATNIDEVVRSMVQWGRQGKEQTEVIKLTEAALLAANVAEMDAKESVDLLTSAILQFNKDASEAVEIVDRLNEVANNYATTARDLAMSIRESGAAARNAGVNIDELIGMTTALSASTAKTGNRIGRALRTIFSRILGDAQKSGEALGKVEVALNSVGVALRKSETEYRDLSDVITDLAVKWDELDEVMQANIARAIGGRRRYSDVISLIENWDMALDSTHSSMNSLNSAMKENKTYMESIEAQWKQVTAQFENLALTVADLGLEKATKNMADFAQEAIDNVDDLIVGLNKVTNVLAKVEEKTNLVSAAVSTLAMYIGVKLIPKLSTLFALISSHPVGAAIVGSVGVVAMLVKRWGEYQKEVDKAEDVKEKFNAVIEEGNKLSLEELQTTNNLIEKYRDLVKEYINVSDSLSDMNNAVYKLTKSFVQSTQNAGFHSMINKSILAFGKLIPKVDDTIKEFEYLVKIEKQLRAEHKELDEKFEDTGEFIDALIKKLNLHEEAIKNSVSWIEKYTTERIESTKQGIRETKMLKDKADRYAELAKMQSKTFKQEMEMLNIERELRSNWVDLAGAGDNFGQVLKEVVNKQMDKFGKGGDEITKTIKVLSSKINDLEEDEKQLEKAFEKSGKQLRDAKKDLEKLNNTVDPSEQKMLKLQMRVNKLTKEHEQFGEQLATTKRLQNDFKLAIEELQKGLEGIENDEFLTNIEEAMNILRDFEKQLLDVQIGLKGLETELDVELEVAQMKYEQGDIDYEELLKEQKSAYEDAINSVWDSMIELKSIGKAPDTAKVAEKIKQAFKEAGISPEELGISIDDILDEWDQDSFKNMEQAIEQLGMNIKNKLQENLDPIKDQVEFFDNIQNLMEQDFSDLSQYSEEELKGFKTDLDKMMGKIKFFKDIGIWDSFQKKLSQKTKDFIGKEMGDNLSDDIDKELNSQSLKPAVESLKQLDEIFAGIIGREDWESPILEGPNQDIIGDLQIELSKLTDEIFNVDVSDLDESGLKEWKNQITNLPDRILYELEQSKKYGKYDLKKLIGINWTELNENVDEEVKNINERLDKIGDKDEVDTEGLMDKLTRKEADVLEGFSQKIAQQKIAISDWKEEIKKAEEAFGENSAEVERFKDILSLLENQLDNLKLQKKGEEWWIEDADEDLKKLLNTYKDFDESAVEGIVEANEVLKDIGKIPPIDTLGKDAKNKIYNLYGVENKKEFQKKLAEMIKIANEEIKDTKVVWRTTVAEGINEAITNLEGIEGFANRLEVALRSVISAVFDNETLKNDLRGMLQGDISLGGLSFDFDEDVTSGIMSGMESFSKGASPAKSILTAIGAASGIPGGAAIGSAIGSIGESIFGGVEGKNEMEKAKNVNKKIDQTNKKLKEFGQTYNATKAKYHDDAGFFQSLFGGEDWDVDNLEKAKGDLKDMEELLNTLQQRASNIGSGLKDAIANTFSYQEFKVQFEQTIGQALQDAIINKLIETKLLDEKIKELSGYISEALKDGVIDPEEGSMIDKLKEELIAGGREIQNAVELINENTDIDLDTEVNQRENQTFQAGTTTNITMHNNYVVEAGIFMGTEEEMQNTAEALEPYIREIIERNQGN